MTDDRITDLLQREIDGDLTDAEREELGRLASGDPEIARSRAELKRLSEVLAQVPAEEPPASLRRDLIEALPQRRKQGGWAGLREILRGPRALAYVGAAAAILILAFLGGDFMKPVTDPGSTEDLTGTLAPVTPSHPDSTEIPLDHETLTGAVRLSRDGSEVTLDVDVRASGPVDLRLRWSPRSLELVRVDGAEFSPGGPGGMTLQAIGGDNGTIRVVFSARGSAARSVQFELVEAGETVQSGRLTLPATGAAPGGGGNGNRSSHQLLEGKAVIHS